MNCDVWAVVPAAGRGMRVGGAVSKQYLGVAGAPVISHALRALLAHPEVAGVMVALAADDAHWSRADVAGTLPTGKPMHTCIGGAQRAQSVLAALRALDELQAVGDDALVLVHDAARPNLQLDDISRLVAAARVHADGALLAAPVRDTLKRCDEQHQVVATEPRAALWRALTPQAFRRNALLQALENAVDAGREATDESMAIEWAGGHPLLVEGREDNIKVTTPADLSLAEFLLTRNRSD